MTKKEKQVILFLPKNVNNKGVLQMKYNQLSREQRYTIYCLLQKKLSKSKIAEIIGVHRSTVTRELQRNTLKKKYRFGVADHLSCDRRKHGRRAKVLTPDNIYLVVSLLKKKYSPEQISGRLKLQGKLVVSHQAIYSYIKEEKRDNGNLYKYLRRKKKYRKRYRAERGIIKNKISIEDRPSIVDSKSRIGDWEGDTIVSRQDKAVLVTLVERRSKFSVISSAENKSARLIAEKIRNALMHHKAKVKTITFDNGTEFAAHKQIARKLDADIYFAHPYSSWERGLNENTNGLIRQYFPKGTSLKNINRSKLEKIMNELNHRPRKSLGFFTPYEVYYNKLFVALQT